MIIHETDETSVVATAVASAVVRAFMTKEVPATLVPTLSIPKAAAPVAPIPSLVRIMIEFAVTAVVETVAVPDDRVTLPNELAPAVVVDATLVLTILFPAVFNTRLPLVAVMAPRVAVKVVEAVKDPVTAVFPVALPMLTAPVPPVPIVVTADPEALILHVPRIVSVAVALPIAIVLVPAVPTLIFWLSASLPIEITPAELLSSRTPSASKSIVSSEFSTISPVPVVVTVKLPVPVFTTTPVEVVVLPTVMVRAPTVPKLTAAVSLSVARFSAVPAVLIVAEASPVSNPVTSRDPGAIIVAGRDHVIALPDPVVVISLAVPSKSILPAEGLIAPPLSPVSVSTLPGVIAITFQVATLEATLTKM